MCKSTCSEDDYEKDLGHEAEPCAAGGLGDALLDDLGDDEEGEAACRENRRVRVQAGDVLDDEDELGYGKSGRVAGLVHDVCEAEERDALLDRDDLGELDNDRGAHDTDGGDEAAEEGAGEDDVEEAEA